ncbi:T9SS type B sorting domain-containing protein [Aquimarina mytili]|uniref:T9SS type B sorting domain-containing protein n=1 Tax=Aquimarina mytili TaxID=874423 RepID=A0A936ZTG1_9FLAO|nr:T9SS type B sorting domain-containing protein [Aquimarina mytili]MBL0684378.1 T9SS type B sorting domain-containing protein [Aquimarina mytili]
MKKAPLIQPLIFFLTLTCTFFTTQAQLGFCGGNSGDPIFNETFGTGVINGPQLPVGVTTYTYIDGTPDDGEYTISSFTGYFDWHDTLDHTPGDTDGKSLIFNADVTAGEFFRRTVTGLCENTSYEFSAWLMNLLPSANGCAGGEIPINVRFQIWDNTDTNLLASGDTGDITSTASPVWEQYGLVFQTVPGQTSVILKMINNGNGGCGNDLAIDDIVFRTCGDFITVTDNLNNANAAICQDDTPFSTQLMANPDFSIYATHAYQWQQSTDGLNWFDIPGETTSLYLTPPITSSISYRVKVAEDPINLANPLCNSLSEVFDVSIIPEPTVPVSNGDVFVCENEALILSVNVPNDVTVNWFDSAIGGNLLLGGDTNYQANVAGVYYAEAISTLANCISDTRVPVTGGFYDLPVVFDEELSFCEGENIILDANITNVTYLWNTGDTGSQIVVSTPGTYTVEVTNTNGCSSIKTITLAQNNIPIIENITSNGDSIIVTTSNSGAFDYSIDGVSFQNSNVFTNVEGGLYTISVRGENGCGLDTQDYILLVYPEYFTPNSDGFHDLWEIEGIENYPDALLSIYDRFGKLLKQIPPNGLGWNGIYRGQLLPSSEYWFNLDLRNGKSVQGHFSLIR